MKKKLWFAAIMLSAALTATFSLTACGSDKETVSKDVKSEYIYQSSFQTIDTSVEGISNACMKDGRIYLYGNQWIVDEDEKMKDGKYYNYIMTCNVDGSDVQVTEFEGMKENEYVSVFALDDQQKLRLLTQRYEYNEETGESKNDYYVYTLNDKLKIEDTIKLKKEKKKSDPEYEYFYLDSRSVVFLDGKIYAGVDTKVYTWDEKGNAGKIYENDNNYIQCLLKSGEGKMYVYGWINEGETSRCVFREFDPETGKFGDKIDLGDYNIYNLSVYPAEGNNIFVSDGNNIYTIDLSTGKLKVELNWLNSDVDGDSIRAYFPLEEGKFLAIDTVYDDTTQKSTTEFVTLNKIKASEVKEKETITYASAGIDYTVKGQILSFNKTNKKYRLEIKDYSAYEDSSKQISMDITSGKIPDLLDLRYGVSKEQLVKKGVLTDLYPIMEKDEEIKKEDFIPSVLTTLETDGKLYFLPSSFSLQSLIAGKKIVGDIEGWTVKEMIDMYSNMPKGSEFMQYMSRDWFVTNIISSQLSEYVNWATGEVKFDSDDFIELVEFSNQFPSGEEMDYSNYQSMPTMVKKGKLFLNSLYLWGPSEIQMYTKLYKKQGGYSVLSYPSNDKNNKLPIGMNGCALAITNQCKNKDGAWEFIRQFLTYDYQKNTRNDGFPTRKDALDKMLEYAQATEEFTDEDGTQVYPISSSYGYDDYNVELGPLSDEEVSVIRSMIDRIGVCDTYSTATSDIFEIINEELKAYYAGDKNAKDTADVIQSRVKLYVSQNS